MTAIQRVEYLLDEYANATFVDPDFEKVSLLLHFDGEDGAQSVQDWSMYEHDFTLSSSSNCGLDTSTKVFGTASLQLNAPAAMPTGRLITRTCHSFLFDAEDFFIEFRIKFYMVFQVGGYGHTLIAVDGAYTLTWIDWGGSPGRLVLRMTESDGTVTSVTHPCGWVVNTWYAVAVGRSGTNVLVFINGVLVGTYAIGAITIAHPDVTNVNNRFYIGGYSVPYTNVFQGWIDELRITKGLCRWTGDYTLATEEFPGDRPDALDTSGYANHLFDQTVCENPEWFLIAPGNSGLRFYPAIMDMHTSARAYSEDYLDFDVGTGGVTFIFRFRTTSDVAGVLFSFGTYDPLVDADPKFSSGFYLGEDGKLYLGQTFFYGPPPLTSYRYPVAIVSDGIVNDGEWHIACGSISPHVQYGRQAVFRMLVDGVVQTSSGTSAPDAPETLLGSPEYPKLWLPEGFGVSERWMLGVGWININTTAPQYLFPGTVTYLDGHDNVGFEVDWSEAWSGENCVKKRSLVMYSCNT